LKKFGTGAESESKNMTPVTSAVGYIASNM